MARPDEQLWRVTAPHFVAGFVPYTYYAPIIRYMVGWDFKGVLQEERLEVRTLQRQIS
jgi:hypothetical protein